MRLYLTKNFHPNEFICDCGCGKDNISMELVQKLQQLRDIYGEPIYISSGVRCERENRIVGGYKNSPHLKGKAADIVARISPITMAYMADDMNCFRIGVYDDHLHLDILQPSPSKYWLCKNGKHVYSGYENDLSKFLEGN